MNLKTLYALIPSQQRRKGVRIMLLMLLRSVLDLAGVAVLLSLLFLLLGHGRQVWLWPALAGGVLLIALKNLLSNRIDDYCTDWFLVLYRHYSSSLLDNYYRRGLLFIRQKGYAELTHQVNSAAYAYAFHIVAPAFRLIGSTVLVAMLCTAFAIYTPYAALIFLLCTLASGWFYTGHIRGRIAALGKAENSAKKQQWRNAQELFRGYAEIETTGAFEALKSRFAQGAERIGDYRRKTEKIQRISPALLETGFVAALAILLLTTRDSRELALSLGLLAVVGMRTLPAMRTIISCWTQIRNYAYTAQIVAQGMEDAPEVLEDSPEAEALGDASATAQDSPQAETLGDAPAISEDSPQALTFERDLVADRISFTYAPEAVPVLDGFSIAVVRGKFVGIEGRSGIGKSTLFNLLLGFYAPLAGQIRIDGVPLTRHNRKAWHTLAGYVPQEVFILDGSIAENIALGVPRQAIDPGRIEEVLRQVRLGEWVAGLPAGMETTLGENGCRISAGQKQRLGIARALYKGAEILFLDEATSALDERTEAEILQILRDLRPVLTVVLIAHRRRTLEACDRIVRIDNTKTT